MGNRKWIGTTGGHVETPVSVANGGTGLTSLGSASQVLSVNGAGTALQYSTAVTPPTSTKGDLSGYSTAQARIPIGDNAQVLTADSTQALGLKWATPSSGGGWEELGSTTLTGASAELDVSSLANRTYLHVECYITGASGSQDPFINFNGDEGANYALRFQRNGATQETETSVSIGMRIEQGSTTPFFMSADIINVSGSEKLIIGHTVSQSTSGESTAPTEEQFWGKWDDKTAPIDQITIDRAAGTFNADSFITVWGRNK
jgi:hypothetical protein